MPIRRRVVYATLNLAREFKLHDENLYRRRRGLRPERPPSRELFVEATEDGACPGLPIYEAAPLAQNFRDLVARERVEIETIRLERRGDPTALILRLPARFAALWRGLPIARRREDSFTRFCEVASECSWIGMTPDRVWVSSRSADLGMKDDVPGLALYVNLLAGLDENGRRIPRRAQGPIPQDDEDALGDLAP